MNRRELLAALPALVTIPFGFKAIPGASETEIVGAAHELKPGKKYLFALNDADLIASNLWPPNLHPSGSDALQKALAHSSKVLSEKFSADIQFLVIPGELKIYEMS